MQPPLQGYSYDQIHGLGWHWSDCSTILPSCPATSAKFPLAQAELGRQWNNTIQFNPTHVSDCMNNPVQGLLISWSTNSDPILSWSWNPSMPPSSEMRDTWATDLKLHEESDNITNREIHTLIIIHNLLNEPRIDVKALSVVGPNNRDMKRLKQHKNVFRSRLS